VRPHLVDQPAQILDEPFRRELLGVSYRLHESSQTRAQKKAPKLP
jgi:hypothetical protein